ncbi:hypothetical protein [Mycobacterium sp. 1274761.0]|uniref:hypothetical protein n=1 Tax=Mycobacterium sp. 1274761.0 TaxID=1834077 RepID=UPI000A79B577|nr:hypothetical protein [Mycobacterium sp. 1274761.0]
MEFWDTFNDFRRSTRLVLVVSLVLGVAALTVGLVLDEIKPKWLDGLNFLPNIWSGLTGFLIGAPFALVVLATFTFQREERVALERVNRLTALAWDDFRQGSLELASSDRVQALLETKGLKKVSNGITKLLIDYENLNEPDQQTYSRLANEVTERMKVLYTQRIYFVGEIYTGKQGVGRPLTTEGFQWAWSDLRSKWHVLDQYIRLQRLECGLAWLPHGTNALLANAMSPQLHPLVELCAIDEFIFRKEANSYPTNSSGEMHTKPEDILKKARSDHYDLRVHEYCAAAEDAWTKLHALRIAVLAVEKSDWPAGAGEPVHFG